MRWESSHARTRCGGPGGLFSVLVSRCLGGTAQGGVEDDFGGRNGDTVSRDRRFDVEQERKLAKL